MKCPECGADCTRLAIVHEDKIEDNPWKCTKCSWQEKTPSVLANEAPQLLRVPERFQYVDEVLGAAAKMGLTNCLLISERDDGTLVFLETEMSVAGANWLLDRMKMVLLMPDAHIRREK